MIQDLGKKKGSETPVHTYSFSYVYKRRLHGFSRDSSLTHTRVAGKTNVRNNRIPAAGLLPNVRATLDTSTHLPLQNGERRTR